MKKCVTFISSVLISSAVLLAPAFAVVDVEDAMKEMGKSYRLVMQDNDAASLQKDLATLRAAATNAQSAIPGNMKKQAADSADRKTFAEGMQKLIDQIDAIDDSVYALAGGAGSRRGTGGMRTKLQAASLATSQGTNTIVTNGKHPEVLYDIEKGGRAGTLFPGKI